MNEVAFPEWLARYYLLCGPRCTGDRQLRDLQCSGEEQIHEEMKSSSGSLHRSRMAVVYCLANLKCKKKAGARVLLFTPSCCRPRVLVTIIRFRRRHSKQVLMRWCTGCRVVRGHKRNRAPVFQFSSQLRTRSSWLPRHCRGTAAGPLTHRKHKRARQLHGR